ncbi:MAG: response regulator, partial [Fibromonadales bacterium]|nr:response regulator [Fibromonadales bacterium]
LSDTYDIFTFSSGLSMLKMLEKKVKIPNLILLDIEMPEMNGYEVLKILKNKEDTMHIPVIFLTAKDDFDSESKGLELGAIDYIKKPFSQPLLLERLEKYFIRRP